MKDICIYIKTDLTCMNRYACAFQDKSEKVKICKLDGCLTGKGCVTRSGPDIIPKEQFVFKRNFPSIENMF